MPLAVFTSVFTPVKRPSLPGKLPALDLEVPDAVQYELEDVAHGGVVDGTRVHLHDLPQDLLLTLRVVDRGPASDFSAMISCTMRARSFRARMSSRSTSSTRALSSRTRLCNAASSIGPAILSVHST